MTHKKNKQLLNKQFSAKKRRVAKILGGILCIVIGLCFDGNTASSTDVPLWISIGPIINISSESPWASIDVLCSVRESGSFVLILSAGEYLHEPVRVWVTVQDFCYPFQWEIGNDAIDNVVLSTAGSEEKISDYPIERTFVSHKTDRMSGESIEYLSGWLYEEVFTTVITPGEGSCKMIFNMEPEHAECRIGGDVIIRMPIVASAQNMPIYNMDASDVKAFFESGETNIIPLFSNCMIDGAVLYGTTLDINGSYFSDYILDSNYILGSIQPNPELLFPSCSWDESLQWVPYIAFRDLSYDECSLVHNWISGILIAIGSGLLVLPLSDWINSIKNGY